MVGNDTSSSLFGNLSPLSANPAKTLSVAQNISIFISQTCRCVSVICYIPQRRSIKVDFLRKDGDWMLFSFKSASGFVRSDGKSGLSYFRNKCVSSVMEELEESMNRGLQILQKMANRGLLILQKM